MGNELRRVAVLAWCRCFERCDRFDADAAPRGGPPETWEPLAAKASGVFALARRAATVLRLRTRGVSTATIAETWREVAHMSPNERRRMCDSVRAAPSQPVSPESAGIGAPR